MEFSNLDIRILLETERGNVNPCLFEKNDTGFNSYRDNVVNSIRNKMLTSEIISNSPLSTEEKTEVVEFGISKHFHFLEINLHAIFFNTPC